METETLCSDEDAQDLLRESQISLLQLSTVEVATQLSMRAFELFCAIEPTEYIDDLFKLRSKLSSASLKRFEEAINHETFWVATEVTREPNQLKRMKTIKHFIKIALHCRECKNFSSMFAIIRWDYCVCSKLWKSAILIWIIYSFSCIMSLFTVAWTWLQCLDWGEHGRSCPANTRNSSGTFKTSLTLRETWPSTEMCSTIKTSSLQSSPCSPSSKRTSPSYMKVEFRKYNKCFSLTLQ